MAMTETALNREPTWRPRGRSGPRVQLPAGVCKAGVLAGIALAIGLAGCASPRHRAPVEERQFGRPAAVAGEANPALPGAENAGKPGYYTVRPGDNLMRIGLETGQNWRDIQSWNNLADPHALVAGQVLRVLPPSSGTAGVSTDATGVVPKPIGAAKVEAKPLDVATVKPDAVKPEVKVDPKADVKADGKADAKAEAKEGKDAKPAATVDLSDTHDADGVVWSWPAQGPLLSGFDNASKGLVIAGKAGDPVLAAADGRVVYAGSGLRGYGNLVIVKHNTEFLTAYAHNQKLLVKEEQAVKRGQRIAEMGASDASRVQLHFEIRRGGKPIDPAKLLPAR